MERVTFPDPKVKAYLSRFVPVAVDTDLDRNQQIADRLHFSGGIPAYALVRPGGGSTLLPAGYQEPGEFLAALHAAAVRLHAGH